jgi:DNA repair exonuclease SbcCD ATPase subunit
MSKRSALSGHVLTLRSTLVRGLLLAVPCASLAVAACDGGERKSIAEQIGPATKNISELKQESDVSEEELERRRKEAGFKTKAEIDAELAAENAREMEKSEREWIKTRLKDYKALTADTRKLVDDIEKEAGKWAAAKDPDKAFEKANKGLQDRFKANLKQIDKLSERSTKGGNTQAEYNKLFRPLEEVVQSLGPGIASEPAFTEAIKNARAQLEVIEKALEDIDKDETLTANKFHEGEDDGGKAKKKGK